MSIFKMLILGISVTLSAAFIFAGTKVLAQQNCSLPENAKYPVCQSPAAATPATPTTANGGGSSFQTNKEQACQALADTGAAAGCSEGESGVTQIIKVALNVLSFAAAIAAVVMIIVAGLRYITSNGESNAIKGAKDAILYAIVGIVIVMFAQVIVAFVLSKADNSAKAPAAPLSASRAANGP